MVRINGFSIHRLDKNNIVLNRTYISTPTDANPNGKEKEKTIGYYTTYEGACRGLVNLLIDNKLEEFTDDTELTFTTARTVAKKLSELSAEMVGIIKDNLGVDDAELQEESE